MSLHKFFGPGLMISSAVLFAAMNYCVKMATQTISGSEVAFIRFAFGFVLTLLLWVLSECLKKAGLVKGEGIVVSIRRWPVLVSRGILGGIAILLLYMAFQYGNLTNVTALNYSYAAFATFFGVLVLKERPGIWTWSALAACLLGVSLMVGGGLGGFDLVGGIKVGEILALVSAVVSGLAVVTVRELRKTESTWSIFGSLCLFGAIICAVYGGRGFVVPSGDELWWTIGAAVTGFVAQVAMTAGYRYVTASVGSILALSTVLFSAVMGYVSLGDRLSGLEWVGAVAVLLGSCLVAFDENAAKPRDVRAAAS